MAKILLVDDDSALLTLYGTELKSKGHQVVTASDGDDGLSKAVKEKPNLILLDIMMPKMDGIALLTKLKEEKDLNSIPVVMLTNFGQENLIQQAFSLGATDYLLKYKVTPSEMAEKVGQVLNSKPVEM